MEKAKIKIPIFSTVIASFIVIWGVLCFFDNHPILGIILTLIGIIWIFFNIQGAKQDAKIKTERLYQQNCIDPVFCEKTINAIESNSPLDELNEEFTNKSDDEKKFTIEKVFTDILNKTMDDGIITETEENGINRFIENFNINVSDLTFSKLYSKYIKMLTINDLLNGILPRRKHFEVDGYFLNIDKDEQIIWKFELCAYYQEVTTTTYISQHSGGSVRIAKGFYLRTGSTKTTPIKETEMKAKANGSLYICTKNMYFYSEQKSLKIPYKKVVSFTPYSDGLGFQKEGENPKPQAFKGIDGWFAYNLVTNIQNLEA